MAYFKKGKHALSKLNILYRKYPKDSSSKITGNSKQDPVPSLDDDSPGLAGLAVNFQNKIQKK